jgi:hypothetical protein
MTNSISMCALVFPFFTYSEIYEIVLYVSLRLEREESKGMGDGIKITRE